jgi:hypothetical protein
MPAIGYSFKWKPLFELDEVQLAQVGLAKAQTLSSASAGNPMLLAGQGELREMAGLPAAMPDDMLMQGGISPDSEMMSNMIIIRHVAERLPPTSDPLPNLPTMIMTDDKDLEDAITQFELDHPEFKGVFEAEMTG